MNYRIERVGEQVIAVVAADGVNWNIQPEFEAESLRSVLIVDGREMARFFRYEPRTMRIHYKRPNNGKIYINGSLLKTTVSAPALPNFCLIELRDHEVRVITTGILMRFLTGQVNDITIVEDLQASSSDIADALLAWRYPAKSDLGMLTPLAQAIYARIQELSPAEHQ